MINLKNIQHRLWNNAQYKFSIIFSSLYVVLFLGKSYGNKILLYIIVSILLSIGIAGIGYVLNDLSDYKDDVINGKRNLFINLSTFSSIFLTSVFIVLSIFPWFILPFDYISLYLIIFEILLFFFYALPPFRWKEKGFLGVISDALYAQVVPCILATYTYSKIENNIRVCTFFLVVYLSWLILLGIRNILNHQREDFSNDISTNTNTFVIQIGIKYAENLIMHVIIPIELALFSIMLYMLPQSNHLFFYCYLIYAFVYISKEVIVTKKLSNNSTNWYSFFNRQLLNEFYEIHLPILLLIYFSYHQSFFIWILVLNLLLFLPIYIRYTIGFFKKYF